MSAVSTKSEQSQQHELPSTAREESHLREHLATGEHLSVSEAETEEEFEQVGWLRARAFYEVSISTTERAPQIHGVKSLAAAPAL